MIIYISYSTICIIHNVYYIINIIFCIAPKYFTNVTERCIFAFFLDFWGEKWYNQE